jgi:two-component system nitrogen regulation response regulator NtrX
MIGSSPQIKSVIKLIDKVAKTNSKVLIHGESGTGKELVAWAIHHKSDRRNNSFIRFNSAAIPNDLVESELFGYEKGAFTGADTFKKGKIEEADNGTLFLDEIGDMSLSAQAKILRVIQEGEFERVGSNKPIKIDARIIAATHKDLPELVRTGQFREDLYYRLNVVPIEVPALRDRISDIDDLAQHFSKLNAKEMKVSRKTFSKEALDYLKKQRFDGNIRELRNLIERIYIMFDEEMVDLEMLTILNIRSSKGDSFWEDTTTFSEKKIEFERKYLSIQLQKNDYSVSKTSSALGLQQSNLSRKLKDLKISTAKK